MTQHECIVCGARSFQRHWDILVKCGDCGFVTAPLEGPLDAALLYNEAYFCGAEYLDYAADERLFKRNFRRRLRDLLRWKQGGRLLEIGAAHGFFLDLARRHFEVVGVEINPQAAAHARSRGLRVFSGDLLSVDAAELGGPLDVAVMLDVIEHLERPDLHLARLAQLCPPGAVLLITTGDAGSWVARRRGRRWRLVHPPTHLHYFDRHTLGRLLARHGFEVREVRTAGVSRSLRQIAHSMLAVQWQMPRVFEAVVRVLPAPWGFSLNLGDIMQVVAIRA